MSNDGLRRAAETAIGQCMDLTQDESCAVVTDDERRGIGEALYEVASETTDDAVFLQYPPGDQHGAEPPEPVAAGMHAADVFVAPTTKSISHTRARSAAAEAGVRGATMPGITEDVIIRGLNADYGRIEAACADLLDQVADADEVRVTSPQGTDITVEPGDRPWTEDVGLNHDPGDFSNLPAGEVFVSPVDANGTYVVDGTMMPHGLLDPGKRLEFEVTEGDITHISDEAIREQVEAASEEAGDAAYNLAELGIGANVGVTELAGSVLLDEKAGGTVHLAIGDDHGIGGDVEAPLHLDGILTDPTVYADGTEITLPES